MTDVTWYMIGHIAGLPAEELLAFAPALAVAAGVLVTGLRSHFARPAGGVRRTDPPPDQDGGR